MQPPVAQQVSLAAQARSGAVPGQSQCPLMHSSPALQAWPQAPQFMGSLERSLQVWPQQLCPAAQVRSPHLHTPLLQLSLTAQAWPQVPQLAVELARLAQPLPAQQVSVLEQIWPLQVQAPLRQVSAPPQPLPHIPQLALSLLRSTHSPFAASQHWPGATQGLAPQGQLPVDEQPLVQHNPPVPQATPPLH